MTMTDDLYEPTDADIHWLHTNGDEPAGWQFVDLSNPDLERPPEPPEIHDLLYPRQRHVISGPPESAKTLVGYLLLLEAQRAGHICALVDFEMGAYAARRLLTDLGATLDELRDLQYIPEPAGPPPGATITRLLAEGTSYVLIDAAIGAYDASGLDDMSRRDVERWARQWVAPLWKQGTGASTIVVDHVTKNAETRGKFTIGSERKLGGADIHLGLEAIKTLTRGSTGLIKVTVHKDRPGYMDRPTACYFELQSDPETHKVAWQIRPHDQPDETGSIRPTTLMEYVSIYLEQQHEPVSRNQVETNVKGKSAEWKRRALDRIILEGYATEETGPRGARLVTAKRPYRKATDPLETTSSDLVPTSSGRSDLTSSDELPPQGGSTRSNASDETTSSTDTDEDDATPLFDDDIPF